MLQPLRPNEETLNLISESAKVDGDGRFIVKLYRRRTQAGGAFQQIAGFEDASLTHVVNLEKWAPALLGGGDIAVRVHNFNQLGRPVGDFMIFSFPGDGFPDQPRLAVLKSKDWAGPETLTYPSQASAPAPLQLVPQPPLNGYAPGSVVGAPPWGPTAPAPTAAAGQETLYLAREKALIDRELQISREQAKRESELAHERTQAMAELERRKLEAQVAEIQRSTDAKIEALIATLSKPKEDTTFDKILPIAIPLVLEFLKESRAAREAAAIEARAERKADADRQAEFMRLQMAKPAISEEVRMMFDMMSKKGDGSAEMMTRMVDAMSTVSKTSVSMIQAVAELQLGDQPENPVIMAIREGVKAIAQLSSGAAAGAKKTIPQPSQLPYRQAPGVLAPPQQTFQQPGQYQPMPPLNGKTGPEAEALLNEIHASAVPNMPQAFDGLPPNPNLISSSPLSARNSLEKLEELIKAHTEPLDDVADFFFESLSTPEMQLALQQVNGNVDVLIQQRLGPWLLDQENREYLSEVGKVIQEIGVERKIFAPETEEEAAVTEGAPG